MRGIMKGAIAPTFGDIEYCRETEWTLERNRCQPIPADPTVRDFYYLRSPRWRLKIPYRVGALLWEGPGRTVTTAEVQAAYEEAGASIADLAGQARANAMDTEEATCE